LTFKLSLFKVRRNDIFFTQSGILVTCNIFIHLFRRKTLDELINSTRIFAEKNSENSENEEIKDNFKKSRTTVESRGQMSAKYEQAGVDNTTEQVESKNEFEAMFKNSNLSDRSKVAA
jgi:hypothetical protein